MDDKGLKTSGNDMPSRDFESVDPLLQHDLRSAVFDIVAALRLLEGSKMSDKDRANLTQISASTAQLVQLVGKDNRPLEPRLVQDQTNAEFLGEIEGRFRAKAISQGIAFDILNEVPEDAPLVTDWTALTRLVSNVVENAIKFTDAGRVSLHIVATANGGCCIKVQDTGPGFSDASLHQLFKYKGRPTDARKPGTGLGLFIARQMARRLSAEIDARNSEDGSQVTISIPPVHKNTKKQEPTPTGQRTRLDGLHILVVEDNQTNQMVACNVLHSLGASTHSATDGEEGWALVNSNTYDLAIIDIEMPKKSGLDLIRDIRAAKGDLASLPLIVHTAYVLDEHKQKVMAAGADGIIAKPITDISDFGSLVLEYLFAQSENFLSTAPLDADHKGIAQSLEVMRAALNPDKFHHFLDTLDDDLLGTQKQIELGARTKDEALLRCGCHILTGLAGAIGADQLTIQTRTLHTQIGRSCCTSTDPLVKGVLQQIAHTRAEVSSYSERVKHA